MKKTFLFVLLVFTSFAYSQQIRVMSYNVNRLPANSSDANCFFDLKTVTSAIHPSIIMLTELDGSDAVQQILSKSLSAKYKASTEVKISWGTGNECAVFYLDSIFTYLGSAMISADTRPIAEFKFVHKFSNDTLLVFGVHLKAYPEETTRRLNAVNSLRNRSMQLKPSANYIVLGDFNIFTSLEPAFQRLLDKSSNGYFIDPINTTGNWNGNADNGAACTYSATNLNTRLDMILISPSLKQMGGIDYGEGSFKIFGNDGNHFGKSVTSGINSWFTDNPSVGTALVNVTDHLPVYADFMVGVESTNINKGTNLPSELELKQNFPNPFNPETTISYMLQTAGHVSLKVYDIMGQEIATLVNEFKQPGSYNSKFSVMNSQLSSAIYFYQLKVGNFVQTKKMVFLK